MRTCVIFNPTAKGDKARRFRRQLDTLQTGCTFKLTQAAGDARHLAAEAVRENFDTVVAAGGDGTFNEVLNGIGDEPGAFDRVRLGLFPLGTMNVVAKELGIPIQPELAWQTLQQGRETAIDLATVEFTANGAPARRYFAQLAGAGLDARAIEQTSWALKKKIGPLAYVVAGLKALLGEQSRITATNGAQSVTGELVLIGNGRFYGGKFAIFPEADLRDGLLEVCVFPHVNWLVLGWCALPLLTWGLLPEKAVRRFRWEKLTLTTPSSAHFQLDGELVGNLPATFSLQRNKLRVLVP
ncbi:MAG: diacylglycerol kinase family lipid kinase [Verrucomicrobia bacterium]|nr:diacylglycerol kinase family lipid kinase [Verrucomicrobiota bacterium]